MSPAAALLLVVLLAPGAPGRAAAPPPLLAVESIAVAPASPRPDELCKLRVTLRNRGNRPASHLRFAVRLGGRPVEAYRDELWLQAVPPGATAEVALYNFWSTETSRPAPPDGRLAVEVALEAARFMTAADDGKGAVVWTPAEAVEGLPSSRSLTLALRKPGR